MQGLVHHTVCLFILLLYAATHCCYPQKDGQAELNSLLFTNRHSLRLRVSCSDMNSVSRCVCVVCTWNRYTSCVCHYNMEPVHILGVPLWHGTGTSYMCHYNMEAVHPACATMTWNRYTSCVCHYNMEPVHILRVPLWHGTGTHPACATITWNRYTSCVCHYDMEPVHPMCTTITWNRYTS